MNAAQCCLIQQLSQMKTEIYRDQLIAKIPVNLKVSYKYINSIHNINNSNNYMNCPNLQRKNKNTPEELQNTI